MMNEDDKIDKDTEAYLIKTILEKSDNYTIFLNYLNNVRQIMVEMEVYSLRTNIK